MNKRRVCVIAMLAIASLLAAVSANAKTEYFQGPTGDPLDYNWSTVANWNGGLPVAGDTTYIDNGHTAVLDVDGFTRYLRIGTATNSGGLTISHDLTLTSRFELGYSGTATSTVTQTAGTLDVGGGQFYLGARSATYGTDNPTAKYYLQGGTIKVLTSSCNIGHRGIGQMYQTGGEFITGAGVDVAIGSADWGNTSLYDISAGSLTAGYGVSVGPNQGGILRVSGTGFVNAGILAMGGSAAPTYGPYTATVNQEGGTIEADSLVRNAYSTCTYSLSGGVLRLTSSTDSTVGLLRLLAGTGDGGTIEAGPDVIPLPKLISNVDFDAQAGTVKVPLAGDGIKLVKSGAGTVTLAADNVYTGDTLVNEGTLKLTGSVTSNVSVASGATLMGGGTVTGAVTSVAGGDVAPGASIGTLTITGNATLGGTLDIEYDSGDDTIDVLSVSGELNLGGGVLKFSDLATTPVALDQPAYVFASYGSLAASRPTEQDVPDSYIVDYAYGEASNQIALVLIPEPSTIVLLVVVGAAVAAFRRRG